MRPTSPSEVLLAEVGPVATLRIALGLAWRRVRERPFRGLGAPSDRKERLSRKQALPAILLYRELLARYDLNRALQIAGKVVHAGAVEHLTRTLGTIDADDFAAKSDASRLAQVRGWLDKFFTATASIDDVSAHGVSFTVKACALARLAKHAGHPELAACFCSGDKAFFEEQTPPILLDRPFTIASGGESCPFTLTLGDRG